MANTKARRWFDATRNSRLTDEEIELCVKLAKDAARETVNNEPAAAAPTKAEPRNVDPTAGVFKYDRFGKWVRLHPMRIPLVLVCAITIHDSITADGSNTLPGESPAYWIF